MNPPISAASVIAVGLAVGLASIGSPCGCSVAYSPSAYLTLPKHIWWSTEEGKLQ